MAAPPDTTSTFTIQELSGEKRTIILMGRALPYRPVTFSGKLRAEFARYPGNPVATVQVLGPEEGQTTIKGYWKDRFLNTIDANGNPVQPTAFASVAGGGGINNELTLNISSSQITSVRELVSLVDDIRRTGQLLEISWDTLKREGLLVEFEHTWHNIHDVEWQMTYEWSSQADPDPPMAVAETDTSDFQSELSTFSDAFSSLKSQVALGQDFVQDLNSNISQVESAISSVSETVSQVISLVMAPIDAARRVLGIVEYTKASANDVIESTEAHVYRSLVTPTPLSLPNTEPTEPKVTSGRACAAAKYLRNVRANSRDIKNLSAQRAQELSARLGETEGATIIRAKIGQDLRDISIDVYGTPDQWRMLKSYNGLTSSKLTAGQVVLIPPKQRAGEAQL